MRLLLIGSLLFATAGLAQPQGQPSAPDEFKFLSPQELDQLLAKPQPGRVFGTTIVSNHHDKGYYVEFVKRQDHGNEVEVHPAWIDQIAILSGEGTMTYGGTLTKPRTEAGGEVRGESQIGAVTKALQPGDFILIPAGQPHKFDAAPGKTLTYALFKVRA